MTVYNFYAWPLNNRPRVSQVNHENDVVCFTVDRVLLHSDSGYCQSSPWCQDRDSLQRQGTLGEWMYVGGMASALDSKALLGLWLTVQDAGFRASEYGWPSGCLMRGIAVKADPMPHMESWSMVNNDNALTMLYCPRIKPQVLGAENQGPHMTLMLFGLSVIGCYIEHRPFEEPTQGSLATIPLRQF